MEKMHEQGTGKGQSFYALSRGTTLLAPPCVSQSGNSQNPFSEGVLWRLHHLGMNDNKLNLQLFPLPGGQGMGLKIPTL